MTAVLIDPVITVDDRAKALVRFAELAIVHDFPEDALPAVVATLASPALDNVDYLFSCLVDAVRDQQAFNADPRGWADLHDHPTSERALEVLDEALAAAVDACTWSLLHPVPACVRCARHRPLAQQQPADWPRSRFCTHHADGWS